MKRSGAAAARPCLGFVGFALLLLSVIFSVVGLKGEWGRATFNIAGLLSGQGDFTLWDVTVHSEVPLIGLPLPATKVNIDAALCNGDLEGTELGEVCRKLHGIRVAIVIGLVCAVLADVCASVALAASLVRCMSNRDACTINAWLLLAGICAVLTSVCAVIALSLALSMPDSERFRDFVSPGAGSVCTGLLLVCSLLGAAFEIASWCAARNASGTLKSDKAPRPADEVC